jgi:hypothetical protein
MTTRHRYEHIDKSKDWKVKYVVEIKGNEIEVDAVVFGADNTSEGWAELYITVEDLTEDIFDSSKNVWIEWLNANCGDKHNPGERILRVVVKVFGGPNDNTLYRTMEIEHAYLASYVEKSQGTDHSYSATIRRAPRRRGEFRVGIA